MNSDILTIFLTRILFFVSLEITSRTRSITFDSTKPSQALSVAIKVLNHFEQTLSIPSISQNSPLSIFNEWSTSNIKQIRWFVALVNPKHGVNVIKIKILNARFCPTKYLGIIFSVGNLALRFLWCWCLFRPILTATACDGGLQVRKNVTFMNELAHCKYAADCD